MTTFKGELHSRGTWVRSQKESIRYTCKPHLDRNSTGCTSAYRDKRRVSGPFAGNVLVLLNEAPTIE